MAEEMKAQGINANSDLDDETVKKLVEKYGTVKPPSDLSSRETDQQRQHGININLAELPSKEEGPPKSVRYAPSQGYEPYWINGSWVYNTVATNRTGDPETNCGLKCGRMYKLYGIICARNIKYQYKTFYNICEMKSEDCKGLMYWTMVYRGSCFFNKLYHAPEIVSNISPYINRFVSIYGYTQPFIGFESRPKHPKPPI